MNSFFYVKNCIFASMVTCVGLLGCASNEPTKRFSQQDALRIVTLCSAGMSQSLVTKLQASYVKNANAKIEGSAGQEARGIIFSDSTLSNLSGAEKVQMAEKYQICMKEMESRR